MTARIFWSLRKTRGHILRLRAVALALRGPRLQFHIAFLVLLTPTLLHAELRRIEVRRRDDFGRYERIVGRAFFSVDPKLPANRNIADIDFAPTNAEAQVEFSSDLLYFRPK